jgi:hypothetical protein
MFSRRAPDFTLFRRFWPFFRRFGPDYCDSTVSYVPGPVFPEVHPFFPSSLFFTFWPFGRRFRPENTCLTVVVPHLHGCHTFLPLPPFFHDFPFRQLFPHGLAIPSVFSLTPGNVLQRDNFSIRNPFSMSKRLFESYRRDLLEKK